MNPAPPASAPIDPAALRLESERLESLGRLEEALSAGEWVMQSVNSLELEGDPEWRRLLIHFAGLARKLQRRELSQAYSECAQRLCELAGESARGDLASALDGLGLLCREAGQYTDALAHHRRALELRERGMPASPDLAISLNGIGTVLLEQGEFYAALPVFNRSRALREAASTGFDAVLVTTLHNLGYLHWSIGEYLHAGELFGRVLELDRAALGPQHPELIPVLNTYAALKCSAGNYSEAIALLQTAIEIATSMGASSDLARAHSLSTLGHAQWSMGDPLLAATVLEEALAIRTRALGEAHPHTLRSLTNLGLIRYFLGDYPASLQLLNLSLVRRPLAFGDNAFKDAHPLENCARVYTAQGDYGSAEVALQRVLELRTEALGAGHPDTIDAHRFLLPVHLGRGDRAALVERLALVIEGESRFLQLLPYWGSEAAKRLLIDKYWPGLEQVISLALLDLPGDPALLQLAAEMLCMRKGSVEEVLVSTTGASRSGLSESHQGLLDEDAQIRSQLAAFTFGASGPPDVHRLAQLAQLTRRLDVLEAQQSSASQEYSLLHKPFSLGQLQQSIPQNAVLVEVIRFRPYRWLGPSPELSRWGAPRYAAFLLDAAGMLQAIDMGEASVIDDQISEWREQIARGQAGMRQARALDQLLWEPLEVFLNGHPQVFIAPDGALNQLPWGATLQRSGRFRIEDYEISYLSAGREMLWWQKQIASPAPAMLVGAPDYGDPHGDPERLAFVPLPGALSEVHALQPVLGVEAITGKRASAEVLRTLQAPPRILHLATHAFFLKSDEVDHAHPVFTPLLRAGIALADANVEGSEGGGLLTALELGRCNLWGTQLVVLSACETGIGESHRGAGVYGLRRALAIAGSRAQLLTLWQVEDAFTMDLMTHFYQLVQAELGPATALRQAQLRALSAGVPFTQWAAFAASGCPDPLR